MDKKPTLAQYNRLSNKKDTWEQFSMAYYKPIYNKILMLERFKCRFAINPNTAKNQKIVKGLMDFGKIAT